MWESRLKLHKVKYNKFEVEFKRYAFAGRDSINIELLNEVFKACSINLTLHTEQNILHMVH